MGKRAEMLRRIKRDKKKLQTRTPSVVLPTSAEVEGRWAQAELVTEEQHLRDIARSLIRWVGSISLATLVVLVYVLTLEAFVPEFESPWWMTALLSSGALTGPVTCFIVAARNGLIRRKS